MSLNKKVYTPLLVVMLSFNVVLGSIHVDSTRIKRGAAYAGGHPGGGYGAGGVGIPGLNNAMQYSAYSQLLNSGHPSSSSGYGSSGHGRKLTVDQAIGMYGHHTLSNSNPYTASHGSSSGGGGGGHSSGGGGGSRSSGSSGSGGYGG